MNKHSSQITIADSTIHHIIYRAIATQGIILCLELGIFEYLQEKKSLEEVANKFDLNYDQVVSLLAICCSDGLVEQTDGYYYNSELTKIYLIEKSEFYYGSFINHLYINQSSTRSYTSFKESFLKRDERNLLFSDNFFLRDDLYDFLLAMHSKSIAPSKFFLQNINLVDFKTFTDIGGGIGTYIVATLNKYRHIRGVLVDRPEVIKYSKGFIKVNGLQRRVTYYSIDFFKEKLPVSDVFFLSDILHDWSKYKCKQLLINAYNALTEGGIIIIHEICLNDDLTGPLNAAGYSLSMQLTTEGRQYSRKEIFELLAESNFHNIQYDNVFGDWSIIYGYK